MQKLKPGDYNNLTDNTVKVLAQNRIYTIQQLLQEDTEKLSTITKLSLSQILDIRSEILLKYSAPLINGTTLLLNSVVKSKFIPTGIQSLDEALSGGLPVGSITEVCGLADSGKTQLCLQLAINSVKSTDNIVLYVDTKGDFSANRIQKILDVSGYSYKEMAPIMFQIRIVHVWTMDELLELFEQIKNKNVIINNLRLIIVDSLPCLMFQYLGDDNKVGLTFLNKLVNYTRYLCKTMDIGVVCVNIQTRWLDQDIFDIDDDVDQSTNSKEMSTERRNRCLGKYWQHIPASVLMLEKSQDNNSKDYFSIDVNVTVLKNFGTKCSKKCILKVSDVGVT